MHAIVASHTSNINTSIDRQLLFLSLHISTPRIHNSPSTRPLSFTPPPSLSLSLSLTHTLSLISPQRHTSSFHASSPHTYSHTHTTHISSLFLFPPSLPPVRVPLSRTWLRNISLSLPPSRSLSRSLLSHFCCWILNLPTVFWVANSRMHTRRNRVRITRRRDSLG